MPNRLSLILACGVLAASSFSIAQALHFRRFKQPLRRLSRQCVMVAE